MRFQKYVWLVIGTIHLGLVACGAGHISYWKWGMVGSWLQSYGEFSGSARSYSFFAPNVGSSVRAEFDLYGKDNQLLTTDTLQPNTNREADLRVINIVEYLQNDLSDDSYRRMLATSWVGKLFARHPDAFSVVLRLEVFDFPSMREFQDGVRYRWEPIYQARFMRKGKVQSE